MERDDLIVNDQYSKNATHSEEEGKKIRKKIWKVTILLSIITIVEVGIGLMLNRMENPDIWGVIKVIYIVLTLAKAAYIVAVFMHLGDERKALRYTIIIPYGLFIVYLIFIAITESAHYGQFIGI